MNKGLKEKILALRRDGKSYNEIQMMLDCSKGVISYHCAKLPDHAPLSRVFTQTPIKPVRSQPVRSQYKRHPLIGSDEAVQNPLTPKELVLLRWLLADDVSRKDVAEVLGLSYTWVIRYARREFSGPKKPAPGYEGVKRRRRHLKMLGVVALGAECSYCGYHKALRAFHFHHNEDKDFALSNNANRSWASYKSEILKCRLACSNCHAEQHEAPNRFLPTW